MELWDSPVYKRLALSELGVKSHTSGIVPSTDTQDYFGKPLQDKTHLIQRVTIEFWAQDQSKIITTNVNYFVSPTHRHSHLTGSLLPTYKDFGAQAGDELLFWKSKIDPTSFKAELLKPGSQRMQRAIEGGLDPQRAGGHFILNPPGLASDDLDISDSDYQILSEVEEDLTARTFPTISRQGRRELSGRLVAYRNKAKADFVAKQQSYVCQIDNSHISFVTPSGIPYVEKHHLISMSFYDKFDNDLDDIKNIIALCPTCHRKIHLGKVEEKGQMLGILFDKYGPGLIASGFPINLDELKDMYGSR